MAAVRERIEPAFRLQQVFGEQPPFRPEPGYLDPFPVEAEPIGFPSGVPGAVFRALGEEPVDVDPPPVASPDGGTDDRLPGSLVLPLFANVLVAKAGLFALDNGLGVTGRADGALPLFRYEYLRDQAKELIAQIQTIESRMLPIQFQLDDFAEVVDAIRRPLAARQAELEAVKQRITELTQGLAQLAQLEQALDGVVTEIKKIEDECDCDWFCWLATIVIGLFVTGLILAAFIALGAATAGIGAAALGFVGPIVATAAGAYLSVITYEAFTCENIAVVGSTMRASLAGVRAGIDEAEAELAYALAKSGHPDRHHQRAGGAAGGGLPEQRRAHPRRQDPGCDPGSIQLAAPVAAVARADRGETGPIGVQLRARHRCSPDPGRLQRSRAQGLHRGRDPCCTISAASTRST